MSGIRLIDADTVAAIVAASRASPRRRANHNLHPALDDPIQRFLNVLQPDSYVRPHRHGDGRFELFLVLAGSAATLIFDEVGTVAAAATISPAGARAVEISGATWHTLIALEHDTVLFEVKPGPYRALTDKEFAPWAPQEGEASAAAFMARWRGVATSTARAATDLSDSTG